MEMRKSRPATDRGGYVRNEMRGLREWKLRQRPPFRPVGKKRNWNQPSIHPSIWQRRPRALSQTTATHSRAFTLIKSSSSSAKLVHKCFNGKAAPAEGADCNHLTPFIRKNQFFSPSFTSICTLRRLTRNCAEHFSIFFFLKNQNHQI